MVERLKKLQAFLEESPNDPFLIYAITLEHLKLGDAGEARKGFERLVAEHPGFVATYYHYAKFLEESDEKDKAVVFYKKGMETAKQAKDNHSFRELQNALQNLLMDEDYED